MRQELALQYEKEDADRYQRHDGGGRPQAVIRAAMRAQRRDAYRQELQIIARRGDQRPGEAHELVGEDDDRQDDEARLDERQHDAPIDGELAQAVEAGGILQIARQSENAA